MNRTLKIISLFILGWQASHGFLSLPLSHKSLTILHSGLEQLPGESDIEFIKRITSEGIEKRKANATETKPKGKYQRIEEWDEERKEKGTLTWEEKVQFEGQKYGNQVRQNEILNRNLKGF